VGERRDERLQIGPLEQMKALEVEDANGDTPSLLFGESQYLVRSTGSDPGSGHHRKGVKTSGGGAAHLENGLGREGDQTIRSSLLTPGLGRGKSTRSKARDSRAQGSGTGSRWCISRSSPADPAPMDADLVGFQNL
jgi:hypothetical protein